MLSSHATLVVGCKLVSSGGGLPPHLFIIAFRVPACADVACNACRRLQILVVVRSSCRFQSHFALLIVLSSDAALLVGCELLSSGGSLRPHFFVITLRVLVGCNSCRRLQIRVVGCSSFRRVAAFCRILSLITLRVLAFAVVGCHFCLRLHTLVVGWRPSAASVCNNTSCSYLSCCRMQLLSSVGKSGRRVQLILCNANCLLLNTIKSIVRQHTYKKKVPPILYL